MSLARYRKVPGAAGDMYYRTAAGLWVPVTGTATTGQVPTKQGDGTVAWVDAAIVGGVSTPTVVQSAVLCNSSAVGQVTLGAAPTAGNLLLAIGARWAGTISTSTGWTRLFDQGSSPTFDSSVVFYKKADVSESTTQQFSSNTTGWDIVVFEVSGATPNTIYTGTGAASLSGSSVTANQSVPKTGALGLGMFMAQGRTAPTLTISGATSGTTGSDVSVSNGGPRNMKAFTATGLTQGVWSLSCAYSSSGTDGYAVAIVTGV